MAVEPGGLELPLSLSTKQAVEQLNRLTDVIQQNIGDADKLRSTLERALGELPKNARLAQQALRELSRGGLDAATRNAAIKGAGAQLNTSPLGQFSQIANQRSAFMNNAIRGGKNALEQAALENKDILAGNRLGQLRLAIKERELKLAKALQESGGTYTGEVAKANQQLSASVSLLDRLNSKSKQQVTNERYLAGVKARSAMLDGKGALGTFALDQKTQERNELLLAGLRRKSAMADAQTVFSNLAAEQKERDKNQKFLDAIRARSAMQEGKRFEKELAERTKAEEGYQKKRIGWQLASAKMAERDRDSEKKADEARQTRRARFMVESAKIEERRRKQEERDTKKQFEGSPAGIRAKEDQTRANREGVLFSDGGASLFKIQARLLLHFQLLQGIFNSFSFMGGFIVELDKAFTQLQAIASATDEEMVKLSSSIVDASKETKFSAVEVANAAVILSQAGFSVSEIQNSIGAVTKLATATGSTLEESVDLATSVVSVFNLRAEEMGNVANITTAALNLTKLTVDKLALGIQYAGNVAADSGVGFTELAAVMGQFADSGVRSGSTLGTGIRQLIIDLSNPSEKLTARLKQLGLTVNDVNVKTNGLTGVLKNLRAAGFTSADALETIEVRAAAAFTAIARGVGEIEELQQAFLYTDAAARANEVQLDSLSAKFDRFKNVTGLAANSLSSGIVPILKLLLDGATALVGGLGNLSTAGQAVAAVLTAGVAAAAALAVSRLVGLTGLIGSIVSGIAGASTVMGGFAAVIAALGGPIAVAIAGITALVAGAAYLTDGFGLLSTGSGNLDSALAKLQTRINETKGRLDGQRQAIQSVDGAFEQIISRSVRLNEHQDELNTAIAEATIRFGELGFSMEGLEPTFANLAQQYLNLKATLEQGIAINLVESIRQSQQKLDLERNQIEARFNSDVQADLAESVSAIQSAGAKAVAENGLNTLFSSRNTSDVDDAIRNLQSSRDSSTNMSESDKEILTGVVEALRQLRGAINQTQATQLTGNIQAKQLEKQYVVDKVGSGVDAALASSEIYRNTEMETRLKGVQNADERDKIAKQVNEAALAMLSLNIDAIVATLNPDEAATFAQIYDDKLTSLKTATNSQLGAVLAESAEAREKTLTNEISLLNEEIDVRQRMLGAKTTKDRKGVYNAILSRINEKEKLELAQLKNDKDLANTAPDIMKRNQDIVRARAQAERDDLSRSFNDVLARKPRKGPEIFTYNPNRDAFRPNENRETKNQLELVNQGIDRGITRANEPLRNAQYRSSSFDLIRNQNRVTDVDRFEAEKEQEALETERLMKVSELEQERVAKLQKVRADAELEIASKRAEFEKLNQEFLDGSGKITQQAADELKSRRDKVGKEVEALNSTIVKSQDEVTAAVERASEAQAEYNARIQEYKDKSIAETISGATMLWGQQNGAFDSLNKRIETVTNQSLSALSSGMTDLFVDVATGTKSMSEAFADFGKNLIETFIRIAAEQAVQQIMGFAIGALFGGPAGAGTGMMMGGNQGARAGFAVGGEVRGGTPGRDSVKANLMPGEFVMRKSAVDMVGRDNLDRINQTGRMASSNNQIQPVAAPPPAAPVNVWAVTPDQMPPPGPNDIIAVVARDIRTGGPLKQLIKTVPR
jgi:TP901 family phage tail tape measure protein